MASPQKPQAIDCDKSAPQSEAVSDEKREQSESAQSEETTLVNGRRESATDTNEEQAQRVVNQIHHYMEMHHSGFGYALTDTELIMYRRPTENDTDGR